MSQEKAQLIAPLGNMTVPGVTATGVITATSFEGNISGAASSIKQGSSISAGVVTASSFTGNLTGNIQRLADSAPNISVGVVTATSFSGNLTGSVTDLTSQPAISVGVVTATSFSGPVTGDIRGNITGNVSGVATGSVTGDVSGLAQGGLGVSYNGGWPGAGTSQISAGVVTATSFYGDGSNLDGVSSGPVSAQSVTANSGTTAIDLSNGNLIYMTQSASTTVSFANTENGNVYIIRTKDDNTTTRTITWPTGIGWSGGSAPTLIQDNPRAADAQVFLLVTRNMGETWYGKEVVRSDPQSINLFAMGRSAVGQLGLNNVVALSSPTQVGTASNWYDIGGGRGAGNMEQQAATKSDGSLWTWGDNFSGVLGLNSPASDDRSSPTQVGTDTTWTNIAKGGEIVAATKSDGTFWVWGSQNYGQLGQNQGYPDSTNVGRSSPVQVGTDATWSTNPKHISCNFRGFFAIKTDGTLWGCGSGQWGAGGWDNGYNRSSPTQLTGNYTTWTSVVNGWAQGYATQSDGSLWCWGENEYSKQLPVTARAAMPVSKPIQISSGPGSWSQVNQAVAARETGGGGAIASDGGLWVWGENTYGELGLNTTTGQWGMSQLGTDTTWRTVQGGYNLMVATKTDNTLWTWGRNEYGKLGHNNNISYSSPVQVPGTSYAALIGYCGNSAGNGQSVFPFRMAEP